MEIIIRPLVEEDAYTSVKWRNDPDVFKYTGNTYDHEITIGSELDWIRRVMNNPNDYRCAIIADNTYVGNIYLTDIDGVSAHYHIFIGNKDYWGKGVAKEASKQIVDYAFGSLGLKRIILRVRKDNVRAIRLYHSLGFSITENDSKWNKMILTNTL